MSYIILIVLGTFILGILLEYTRQKIIYIIKFDKILLKIDDLMLAWIKKLIKEKKENVGFSKK